MSVRRAVTNKIGMHGELAGRASSLAKEGLRSVNRMLFDDLSLWVGGGPRD